MRVMIVEVDGLRVSFSLETPIKKIRETYCELINMGSEVNIIGYEEIEERKAI